MRKNNPNDQCIKKNKDDLTSHFIIIVAIRTRLELATSAVTGRRSNQIELPDRERLRMIAFFDFSATFF